MKTSLLLAALLFSVSAMAATASANHGHHGGGNNGALGSSMGMSGASGSSSAAGQSGNGSSYGDWYLKSSVVDNYQPWPQAQMAQFQKP